MEDNKNKYLAFGSIILTILLISIGLSYAYFSAILLGAETETTITFTGGKMAIVFDGGNPNIIAENIYPSSDPIATKTFTVTGNNTTNKPMAYILKLVVDENTFSDWALSYELSLENDSDGILQFSGNDEIYSGYDECFLVARIFTGPTNGNKVHNYALKIYFLETGEDQNEDQGKIFKAHVSVETPSVDLGETAPLKDAILALSEEYEELSVQTIDNYGTAYYFNESMYLLYKGMGWQIIRLNGDDSIRLLYMGSVDFHNRDVSISENQNKSSFDLLVNNYSNNNASVHSDQIKFLVKRTEPDNSIGVSAFQNEANSNAYVGYMYGTPFSTNYNDEHGVGYPQNELHDSKIKEILDLWYETNILNSPIESYVADSYFCNDRRVNEEPFDEYDTTLGYGDNTTYYAGYVRDYNAETIETDFLCDINDAFSVNQAKGNGKLKYPIGLVTMDDYVPNDYSGIYWTMTPSRYEDSVAYNFVKGYYENYERPVNQMEFYEYYEPENILVRPVINISGDIRVLQIEEVFIVL